MRTIATFAILFSLSIGAIAQPANLPGITPPLGVDPTTGLKITGVPRHPPGTGLPGTGIHSIKLNHKPNAIVAYRLEFQVSEQIFFVNSIGGNFLLNVSHTSLDGERAFTIQGEFLPGAGAEVGMLDFEAKLMESNLDDGVNGEYNSKGSTTIKKGQSQQLATLGHHVLSLTVKEMQEKK